MKQAAFADQLSDLLASLCPDGTVYIVIAQRKTDRTPIIISTEDNPVSLAVSLRQIANNLGGEQ
jgi:hypothetical protein